MASFGALSKSLDSTIAVLVDPTSTGRCVQEELLRRGCSVVVLWSLMHADRDRDMTAGEPSFLSAQQFVTYVDEQHDMRRTATALRPCSRPCCRLARRHVANLLWL